MLRRGLVPALALSSALLAVFLLVLPGLARGRTAGREGRAGTTASDPAARAPALEPAAEPPRDPASPILEARTREEARRIVHYSSSAGKGAVPELRRMAEAEDPLVAGNAVRALGRLGAAPAEGRLEDLLGDPRPRVRQEAVMALGLSRDEGAVGALESVLAEGEPELRPLAIQALGRIGGPRARSALERRLEDPAASEVERAFAREALGFRCRPRALPAR